MESFQGSNRNANGVARIGAQKTQLYGDGRSLRTGGRFVVGWCMPAQISDSTLHLDDRVAHVRAARVFDMQMRLERFDVLLNTC